ncbi:uncharacterized protein CC84DRAFT_491499 [Paraphaeosphaeria sporulosa]|uniref:Uncharacterized protein n=1 Tax=Paraphaeosphaeria sporulosa TaxID=1460663 RepID=A0A177CSY9_9PLEO|nr:uncharacterized protein CC84DRAFT_491499 [Paraphaeosphaeria sporulosa]OAG10654.1 hypothetical protein CC84DRAFT_491499 [Paraphaeosphaeria sporulosa]
MELHGLPNDILYSFRLLIESGIIHLLRTVVYPFLAKHKINQGRIARLLLRHIGHCMGYHRSAHHLQCWAFIFAPPFFFATLPKTVRSRYVAISGLLSLSVIGSTRYRRW